MNKNKNELNLRRGKNGILCVSHESSDTEVSIKQCFPWSGPDEFLSLRDSDDNEVYLIKDINELDETSQRLIQEELNFSQFVLKVSQVKKIEEDIELRQFHVVTEQGERVFQTKLEDWPEVLESGIITIQDLAGDIFRIEDWQSLDFKSKKELSAYIS